MCLQDCAFIQSLNQLLPYPSAIVTNPYAWCKNFLQRRRLSLSGGGEITRWHPLTQYRHASTCARRVGIRPANASLQPCVSTRRCYSRSASGASLPVVSATSLVLHCVTHERRLVPWPLR